MIMEFEGVKPTIDKKTFIADGCHIIGKVTLKEYSSIWFNTVVRGDVNSIEMCIRDRPSIFPFFH